MTQSRTILVTGATGQQGGAAARHLRAAGFHVRALTRKPDGAPARALRETGAELAAGDLSDPASVERALAGASGVFAVITPFEAGPAAEIEQGTRLATLARAAGVEHFVYSSVGSAHRRTGIPHFESKHAIEEAVRALAFPIATILRPVYFMENLLSPAVRRGDTLVSFTAPATPIQMIAVDDIGRFAAHVFAHPGDFRGAAIDLAGDTASVADAAAVLGEVAGRPFDVIAQPIETTRAFSDDLARMAEWFERVGYDADIAQVRAAYGVRFATLREWAARAVQS